MILRKPQTRPEKADQRNNTHRMANQLRRYFSPASVTPPPLSSRTQTGNRNTAITAGIAANSAPLESTVLRLVPSGGTDPATLVYKFKNNYDKPPHVTATAITINTNGPQEIVTQGARGINGVIVQSTDPTDKRLVFVQVTAAQ